VIAHPFDIHRHPGLVPGSNAPRTLTLVEGWMPEQVRHDVSVGRRVSPTTVLLRKQEPRATSDTARNPGFLRAQEHGIRAAT
jgi:hypothetical protein